jgi:hypothetical protein
MEADKHGRTPGAHNDLIFALLADGVEESIGVRIGGFGRCRQTLVQLRGVTGAAVGMGPPPQTRHRQGLARVTVMLIIIDCCRSVLTERCSKIAR